MPAGIPAASFQVGMQRRSSNLFLEGRDLKRAGKLGAVRMVRTFWLNNDLEPPTRQFEGPIDWEQWQGPAAPAAKDPRRFFDWRNYSAYSSGVVMDQGAHIFDSIHMIIRWKSRLPGLGSANNQSASRSRAKSQIAQRIFSTLHRYDVLTQPLDGHYSHTL